MAGVWLRSALTAYADIFPPEAPKPTVEQLGAALADAPGLVAVDGDRIIGLVQAHDGWLSHLYVEPEFWQRGIGTQLHDAAVDALSTTGCTSAWLWVLRANTTARSMYERRGWRLTDQVRPVYAPAGIEDVNYTLDL
jgi:GNAT superfamily N-acetyltransferase